MYLPRRANRVGRPMAIDQVRARLHEAFSEMVQSTIDGQGILMHAPPTVDSARFQAVTHETIAVAQDWSRLRLA
ncbi:MAG: hypothetical protein ACJ8AG_21200 [Ktedonobacteraceae bacterium]